MIYKIATLLSLFFVATEITACIETKNSGVSGDAASAQDIFQQSTVGSWENNCYSTGAGEYERDSITFSADSYTYTSTEQQWAGDPSCTPGGKTSQIDTTYQYAASLVSSTGLVKVYSVALTIMSGGTTFYGAGPTLDANLGSICGLTDWVNGVFMSWFVSGENCVAAFGFTVQPKLGMIHYTHEKIDTSTTPPSIVGGNDPFPNVNPNSLSSTFSSNLLYLQ